VFVLGDIKLEDDVSRQLLVLSEMDTFRDIIMVSMLFQNVCIFKLF
jgi:hypothetical protein